MDEKRKTVLLDKFFQYIDYNLSCTLYEVPIPKNSSPEFQICDICDRLYKPSYLSMEFWCDQENAHFIIYQGETQAYDRFCQLAEIAAELLLSQKYSAAPDNKKRWVCYLVDFLRSEPRSNVKKCIYGKVGDFNEDIGNSVFTENREMLMLYSWAKTSTQKKVFVSSSDIKNLFNASTDVLEKMYKSIEGQSLKTDSTDKKKPLCKKAWPYVTGAIMLLAAILAIVWYAVDLKERFYPK